MEQYVRRSPVPLIGRIIVLEIIIFTLEFITRGIIYALSLNQIIFWEFGSLIILILYQLLNIYILTTLVLRWASELYVVRPEEITIITGIFSKKQVTYDTKTLQALTVSQNAFERLFHYGTIRLYNPVQKSDIYLSDISDPEQIVGIIDQRDRSGLPVFNRSIKK